MADLYIQHEYWFAAFQLIFAMFGMGATLTLKDFTGEFKTPKGVTIGTLVQLIAVPIAAYVFILSTGIVGGVAIGIALIAAIPGGTTSNIFTHIARGNSALSIAVTAITTLACLVTTPLILSLLITEYLPANFSMPKQQIITEIALTLLLPLIIGMFVLRSLPNHAPWISKWSIRASLFGILLIIIGSSSAGRLNTEAFGATNIQLVILFVIVLAIIGWGIPTLLGLKKKDSTAIEMEVIVRNVNLGVLIKASMFPAAGVAVSNAAGNPSNNIGDMVLFTLLLYGAVQMLIAAVLIMFKRRSGA